MSNTIKSIDIPVIDCLAKINGKIVRILVDDMPPKHICYLTEILIDETIAAHKLAIAKFFNKKYKPPQHNFPKELIEAKANFLYKVLKLCEKTHFIHRLFLGFSTPFIDGLEWYEEIIFEEICASFYKFEENIPTNKKKVTLRKDYSIENQKLREWGETERKNIYTPGTVRDAIGYLIQVAFIIIEKDDEYRDKYYTPFCIAKNKYNLAQLKHKQIPTIEKNIIKIPKGSGRNNNDVIIPKSRYFYLKSNTIRVKTQEEEYFLFPCKEK